MTTSLEQLQEQMRQAEVRSTQQAQWDPEQCGEIDIRIAADGTWYHEGRAFVRTCLVKLFAGILRREGGHYYLVTPVEKLRIQVEDVPFVAQTLEVLEPNTEAQSLVLTTNVGDRVVLNPGHPLRLTFNPQTQEPRPYVHIRAGLEARVARSVYLDLVELAESKQQGAQTCFEVRSQGEWFSLGCYDLE